MKHVPVGHIIHPHPVGHPPREHRFLTIETVRNHLQDREPGDNSIDNDLFWTDEDIVHAMERCAADYNAVPPLGVHCVNGLSMPAASNVFLYGTLSHLYEIAVNKLARNIVTWSTGDTTVELEKPRMAIFRELHKMYRELFAEQAHTMKTEMNKSLAWGRY